MGGLPDVVPEGTLLNMVLKRMHRPRSCSYQLLLEHQRPSRIQGLRWVSAHQLPWLGPATGTGGGPGLGDGVRCWGRRGHCWAAQWVEQLGCWVCGWHTQLHRVCLCACGTHICPCWRGEGERDLSQICHLCAPC